MPMGAFSHTVPKSGCMVVDRPIESMNASELGCTSNPDTSVFDASSPGDTLQAAGLALPPLPVELVEPLLPLPLLVPDPDAPAPLEPELLPFDPPHAHKITSSAPTPPSGARMSEIPSPF